ncbi:MAG: hypothetical protein IJS65_07775, partial [Clostridia bacterium]|nr:hypothetical protein [Clostridia bacterium]
MKKTLSLLLSLLILFSVFPHITLSATEPALPSAEIKAYNLIVEDNVYISYAVLFENAAECETGLLIWTAPPSSYVYGSADYTLSPAGTAGDYTVFEFRGITVKQMTDDFYAAAYVLKGGSYYYSAPKKYSILQYAYNKLGYTGTRTNNENLADYLESMLKYGGRTQTYENYHTERLASDKFYRVKAENAVLPDGFSSGLYKEGDVVPLTYTGEQTSGKVSWENAEGSPYVTKSLSDGGDGYTVTVGAKNAEYSAKPSYKAVFIGDSRMARYNTADLIAQFARADGINIYGIPVTNYLFTRDAYNLYNLCNSDRTAITNSTFLKAIADETPVDYVFCFAGRDFTLCYSSSRTNERKALNLIKTALLESNPNGRITLISSNGFPDGSPWYDSDFGDTSTSVANKKYVSTTAAPHRLRSEHTAAIKSNAAALNSYVGNFCTMSYVGDGVEYYYNNYYDEYGIDLYDENRRDPSPAGSYLTAAITYAQTFGKTPYGSDVYGKL